MNDSFEDFKTLIEELGSSAASSDKTVIASNQKHFIRYIPFQYVNACAKIVIVGITPGPNQVELAYKKMQELLRKRVSKNEILVEVKKFGAFGSETMRPNLVRMLRHFRLAEYLDILDESQLWGSHSNLIHCTSVVPYAAFEKNSGKPFAGSFDKVLSSSVLSECFHGSFVLELPKLERSARYIALGPTPLAALEWCIAKGHIDSTQVMGAFPHPSTQGGSQVAYFLGEKSRDAFNRKDPVLKRCDWLDASYARMTESRKALTLRP